MTTKHDQSKPMNAIKFIQQHGIEKAREVVEGAPERATHLLNCEYVRVSDPRWILDGYVSIADLKRLVESVDLIKKHGGLFSTKCQLDKGGIHYEWYRENGDYGLTDLEDLEQAIADYEAIYKCTYCNGFGEVGCQFEGTFTCPDCNGDRYVEGEHE